MKLKLIITSVFLLLFSFQGVSALSLASTDFAPIPELEYNQTLRVGSPYYQDVINLQLILQNIGFYTKSIDGKFGPGTKSALVMYQSKNNLVPDGIAGRKTYASFNTENIACTLDYTPVCGQIVTGIVCVTEPCPSYTTKTYSNGCMAKADKNMIGILHEGECTSEDEYLLHSTI